MGIVCICLCLHGAYKKGLMSMQKSNMEDTSNSKLNASFLQRLRKSVETTLIVKSVPGDTVPVSSESNSVAQISISKNPISDAVLSQASNEKYLPYILSQFDKVLSSDTIDIEVLRRISWNGIPSRYRPEVWKMLLGYVPLKRERREETLRRKRKEYFESLPLYFSSSEEVDRTTIEGELKRQILVDLPRTCPSIPFFHQNRIRKTMERILYIWSIRHPASGYVQGMNDLLTPLLIICAQSVVADPSRSDFESLPSDTMNSIEADAYWCFSKLMENIQDHYTFAQPGLQRMVSRLEDLTHRLDGDLHKHLMDEGVQYVQFAFRWMNCALVREMPLHAIIRLWDTYLAEDKGGFENFHVYVCVVILKLFKDRLMEKGFQDIVMFLQDMPSMTWTESDVEPILSQAYILSNLFENAPNHLH